MKNTKGGRALVYGDGFTRKVLAPWIDGVTDLLHLHANIHGCMALNEAYHGRFDVIVDAGELDERLAFATLAWPLLLTSGTLVLPDAHRSRPIGIATAIAFQYFREIDRIDIAPDGHDVTTIHKCVEKPYVNWNKAEGRAAWQVGDADLETTLRKLDVETR